MRPSLSLTAPLMALALIALSTGCVERADAVLEPDPDGAMRDAAPDGAPVRPALMVEPWALTFTAPGERRALALLNASDRPLQIDGIRREGSPLFTVTLDGQSGPLVDRVLLAGERVTLGVEALVDRGDMPTAAELVIETSDPTLPETRVPLVFAPARCLRAAPADVVMGEVALGMTVRKPTEVVNCGTEPLNVGAVGLDHGGAGFRLVRVDGLGEVLGPGAAFEVEVEYVALTLGPARDTLVIDAEGIGLQVPTAARAIEPSCPAPNPQAEPQVVAPATVVELDGRTLVPAGREGAEYAWTTVDQPIYAHAALHEAFYDPVEPRNGGWSDNPRTPTAVLYASTVGRFRLSMRYRDLAGCLVDVPYIVDVRDNDGIAVDVTWTTPDDPDPDDAAGADIDLHLRHPNAADFFSVPYDCYFQNANPDWGQLGNREDDCAFGGDVVGGGTETLSLPYPENTEILGDGAYLAAVHFNRYRGMPEGFVEAPVEVTAQIWVRGEPVYEETETLAVGELWVVGAVGWPSGDVTRIGLVQARDALP